MDHELMTLGEGVCRVIQSSWCLLLLPITTKGKGDRNLTLGDL